MAATDPDPFLRFARDAGPLAPGSYRVVATSPWGATHDFSDLDSARSYADDVASETDYDTVPPAAYVYDSDLKRVGEGMHYSRRAGQGGLAGPAARLRAWMGKLRGQG